MNTENTQKRFETTTTDESPNAIAGDQRVPMTREQKKSLEIRVADLERWRGEITELAELRKRVEDQRQTIILLQNQLASESQRRINAELSRNCQGGLQALGKLR